MRLWLAPHVHAVQVGPDIVVMDVEADAYFCLADAAAHMGLEAHGAVVIDPPQAGEDLQAAGLLLAHPPPARLAALPVRRDLEAGRTRPGPRAVLSALSANAVAATAIKGSAFTDILRLAGPVDEAAFAPPSNDLLGASSFFSRLTPWLPRDGLCLMRSLQQRLFLQRRGHSAAWVFGVRTWPFKAHCWLQAGDVVLDDTVEHVSAFAPIMVV